MKGLIEFKTSGEVKYYSEWSRPLLSFSVEKIKNLFNLVKEVLSRKKIIKSGEVIIGFTPYIEYIKHENYGHMEAGKIYVHSFGNPTFLVFDRSEKCLKIKSIDIQFSEEGIKG